jgi:hypothetical protein
MLLSLLSLFWLFVIAMAAYGLGRPIVDGLGVSRDDRLSRAVWSVTVGLILAGQLLAGCGMLGLLYPLAIQLATWAACFWAAVQILRSLLQRSSEHTLSHFVTPGRLPTGPPEETPLPSPPRWLGASLALLAGLACFGSLLSALAPPTAGDALCYHLELPKAFLSDHAMRFLPDHDNSTFPLLVEMWYLWGLVLDGGVTAQLIHWGSGILFALATVILATPILGRPWAWIAGAVAVLVPGVTNQMTAPLNDVALALLTTLSLAAWWRAVVAGESRRWFVLAGLAAGGALGTKYIALVFAAASATSAAVLFWRSPERRRPLIQGALVVFVVAASVAGMWYVRAAWYRGNPVYPFLAEVFPGNDPAAVDGLTTLPESKSPLGRHPAGIVTAAWHTTMHPEKFGGRGHQFGVLFLAALPGLLLARRLRGLGTLLTTALTYWVLWYLLRQNIRFLLPLIPLACVGVVWVWIEMPRLAALPRLAAGAAFATVLIASSAIPLYRSRSQAPVAFGLEPRERYLASHEPTWAAASVSNSLFGPDAHILTQDYRAFYFQCRVTRENLHRRRTRYDAHINAPTNFSRQLRDSGFTHLLLAENVGHRGIQYDPTLTRLAEAQWVTAASDSLVKLAEYQFPDADGAIRRYRLVALR